MNTKRVSIVLCSIVAVLLTVARGTAWAANATYSPADKTIEKTQPVTDTDSFDLTLTSPVSFQPTGGQNPEPCNSNPFSILVNVAFTVMEAPVSDGAAIALVSAFPDSVTWTAKGQDKTVSITVNAMSAVAGTYVYKIKVAKVPPHACTGWGEGDGTTLTVVIEPAGADTTPPSVTITEPAENQSFTFCTGGTSIPVAFYADDSGSVISDVSADVNGAVVVLSKAGLGTNHTVASGTYTALSIGGFTLIANATSQGGTSDATRNFSVNFNLMWLPPLSLGKTSKGGSTVPVKFTARDCNGNFIHDESVVVVVLDLDDNSNPTKLNGLFGEGASSVRIDDEAGQYIINFQTATGQHNYKAVVYFNDFNGNPYEQGSKTFSVR